MRIHSKSHSVYFRSMFRILLVLVIIAVGLTGSMALHVSPNCNSNEEWHSCGNLLDPTCDDPDLNEYFVSPHECKYACACKDGLVRPDLDSRDCIPLADCS